MARYVLAQMGIVKAGEFGRRSKVFLFSNMVQYCGNRSADICLVVRQWASGAAGHSFSMG